MTPAFARCSSVTAISSDYIRHLADREALQAGQKLFLLFVPMHKTEAPGRTFKALIGAEGVNPKYRSQGGKLGRAVNTENDPQLELGKRQKRIQPELGGSLNQFLCCGLQMSGMTRTLVLNLSCDLHVAPFVQYKRIM